MSRESVMDRHALYNEMAARLRDHVANGTTDSAAATLRVPATQYTDADVWQKEMDGIFKSLPILVGLSHELPEKGDFKTLDILGMPLLICRQADGSAKVLMNVCSHRGFKLVDQACALKNVIRCPYHSWAYDFSGRLIATTAVLG